MNIRTTTLALMAFTTLPIIAQAGKMDAEIQAIRTYCKADVERLCPNVEPGGGRIKACLAANKQQMSVGCAQALQQLKQSSK